jgi:alkaline phosphatase D
MLDLRKLEEAVRYEGGLSRRLFLAYAAGLSAVPLLGRTAVAKHAKAKLSDDPFRLGIASGDPNSNSVVLWTRLAPRPLEPDSGMEPSDVKVAWEIADDDSMRKVIRRGTAVATPQLSHSVHVEVDNLDPDRWYWYRFRVGDAESPIGRTRTMPADDASPPELRFAFASCQHFESGLYTAYEHMAKEELDFVCHLGDYIYDRAGKDGRVRKHSNGELRTLEDFRVRHSQYKTDPLLQTMHTRCPWVVTWDDHEVCNDYAGSGAEKEHMNDPAAFLKIRAGAYQAYYENMPLRHTSLPKGPDARLYRKQSFGRLAELLVLDGRQYRTPQPNDDKASDLNHDATSAKNTMLGKRQFAWVKDSLGQSNASWNVLANQVIMALIDIERGPGRIFPMDEWSGYVHERNALMKFIQERKVANAVVITGDNHANWVNDLRVDDLRTNTPVVATEFVGTSISSGGNGSEYDERARQLMAENPGVKFFNGERGYVRCTVTPKTWQSDFRTVAQIEKPGAPIVTRATYVIESGEPGAKRG